MRLDPAGVACLVSGAAAAAATLLRSFGFSIGYVSQREAEVDILFNQLRFLPFVVICWFMVWLGRPKDLLVVWAAITTSVWLVGLQ